MRPLTKVEAFLVALAGATATVPRLQYGWSSLDDGFYAYVASHLLAGSTLHKDIFSQYLGYQHVLHALFFKLFGENYLVLRFPLPVLNLISALSACYIFKRHGAPAQIISVIITTGFSYLLFNNPSTSWTCACLTLVIIALLVKLQDTPPSTRLNQFIRLLIGITLGITFGTRHPTAVFIGMGILVHEFICVPQKLGSNDLHRRSTILFIALVPLAGIIVYALKSGPALDIAIWFIAPLAYMAYATTRAKRRKVGELVRSNTPVVIGFLFATAPIAVYTAATNSLDPLLSDLTAFSADYSAAIGVHAWYPLANLLLALKLHPHPATIMAASIVLACFAYPVSVCCCIAFAIRRPRNTPRIVIKWVKSPLTIITSFHSLVILGLMSEMYLSYSMAMIMLSLLELTTLISIRAWLQKAIYATLITASASAFCMMSNRLGATNPIGFYGIGNVPWAKCGFAKCDLYMNTVANRFNTQIIQTMNKIAPKEATVTVVPWGYDYQFSNGRKNESIMPDSRIPRYKGEKTLAIFTALVMQPTPFIVFNKAFTTPSTVTQELVNTITKNSSKVFENEIFIVFRPEFIPLGRWPLGNPMGFIYKTGFNNVYDDQSSKVLRYPTQNPKPSEPVFNF